jgi:lipopolysaccharide transport system permease protein
MSVSPATDVASPGPAADADADAAAPAPADLDADARAASGDGADVAASQRPTSAPTPGHEYDGPELIIRPRRGWIAVDWSELWRHRELLYFLVWRDVKVRYKQAILGFAWAIFAPLISVVLFTTIFFRFAGMGRSLPAHVPPALYVFAGLIAWHLASSAIGQGGLSLVSQQNLLSKIYMPRLFIPTASIGGALVDTCISWGVFALMMVYYHLRMGFTPEWTIIFVPALTVLSICASLGIAYTLSAATVQYRDLRFLVPFITQTWMWLSAVAYPPSIFIRKDAAGQVVADHTWVLAFNPLFGIFDAYRAAIFGTTFRPWHLLSSIVMVAAMLTFGLFYFRRTERRFADIA